MNEALTIKIPAPRTDLMEKARQRQDRLVKPPHSLGRLEDISIRLAGARGTMFKPLKKRRLVVMAADNGVVEEGVASATQDITLKQTINLSLGRTGAATLCRHYSMEIQVVDVGVKAHFEHGRVLDKRIMDGTNNFARGPAMTREQAEKALSVGLSMARQAHGDGVQILGAGEMGIGNTTTSSAILSCLLNLPAEATVGRGGCLSDEGFLKKQRVIDQAIDALKPDPNDVIDVLSKVGGLDIAAMCGLYIGAAAYQIPIVIDGLISSVAALCACRLRKETLPYLFASHCSREKGYLLAMNELSLAPILQLDMRLGEGSGCPIAMEVMDAAVSVLRDMATFEEADVDDRYLDKFRGNRRLMGDE